MTSVLSEELHSKIQENVKLHGKLDEIDKRYDVKISDLTSEIESLKHQLRQSSQKDRAEDSKQKELIQGLKFDNAELVAKVTDMEKELVDAKDKITVLKVQLESSSSAIHNSSDSRRGSSKVSKLSLSSSRMPLNITEARIQTVEVLSTLGESVQNFVAASSDIHTYWEHRIKDLKLGSKLTDQSSQLSILLLQNVKFLRPIEQSFQVVFHLKSPNLQRSRNHFNCRTYYPTFYPIQKANLDFSLYTISPASHKVSPAIATMQCMT